MHVDLGECARVGAYFALDDLVRQPVDVLRHKVEHGNVSHALVFSNRLRRQHSAFAGDVSVNRVADGHAGAVHLFTRGKQRRLIFRFLPGARGAAFILSLAVLLANVHQHAPIAGREFFSFCHLLLPCK